jgi:hypothetical protein
MKVLKPLLLCIIIMINSVTHSCAQNQFKNLERNWDAFLPIFSSIILENEGHYILMAPVNGQPFWQLLALDSNGNYAYKNFPKIKTFNRDANTLLYNHKILISDWKYTYEIDTNGNVLNQIQYFNGTLNTYPIIQFNRACNDTNTVFCCGQILRTDTSTFANPLIFKSNNGNVQWSKFILGTTEKNVFRNIDHCTIGNDGMLYSVLSEDSINSINGYISYKVLKTDTSNGTLIWAKKYLETPYYIKDILPCDSTSFLLYGNNDNHNNNSNPYYDDTLIVMRVDASGAVIWCRKYKTSNGVFFMSSLISKIINTKDGGFLLVAPEWQYQGQTNTGGSLAMVKFDSQFNLQWGRSHTFGNPYTVVQTKDDGYLVASSALFGAGGASDVYSYIIKTDSLGLSGCYEDTLVGVTYTTMSVTPVTMNYTTDTVSIYTLLTTAGDTMLGTYSEYDACVFLGVAPSVTVKNNNSPLLVYPNPASTILNIQPPNPQRGNEVVKSITLFDMQGRLILQSTAVNQYPLQLTVAGLTPGIYAVKVICAATSYYAKVVVKAP